MLFSFSAKSKSSRVISLKSVTFRYLFKADRYGWQVKVVSKVLQGGKVLMSMTSSCFFSSFFLMPIYN